LKIDNLLTNDWLVNGIHLSSWPNSFMPQDR